MKKYVKPELFLEQFELSQHVADCALEYASNGTDPASCIATSDSSFFMGAGYIVFGNGNTNCVTQFEQYCYTNGASGVNTFQS